MKKQLSVILIILLLPCCIKAQKTFKQEVSIGASFGMGVSSMTFNPKIKTNQLLGSHFGVTGRWITEKNLGLVFEINYSQQGWDENFEDYPEDYEYSRRINYIDIPFLTHIYFGSERFRFFINLGPKIGFALSESAKGNAPGMGELTNAEFNDEEEERGEYLRSKAYDKRFAWGICGGPGLELRTGIGHFQIEGRYYYALGDIFNNRTTDPFTKSSSQVIYGKITYLIPIIKKK